MGMSASQSRLLSLTARLSDLELQAQVISNAKIRLSQQGADASQAYSDALDKQTMTVYNAENSAYANATVNNLTSYTSAVDIDGTNSKYRYMEAPSGALVATEGLLVKAGFTVSNGQVTGGSLKDQDAFLSSCGVAMKDGAFDQSSASYKYYNDLYAKISSGDYTVVSNDKASDPEWLSKQIEAGNLTLVEFNKEGGADGTGAFEDVSWTSGDSTLDFKSDDTDTARAEAKYEATMASIQTKDKRFDLELQNINTEHTAIQTEMDSVKKVINKNIERSFKIFDA